MGGKGVGVSWDGAELAEPPQIRTRVRRGPGLADSPGARCSSHEDLSGTPPVWWTPRVVKELSLCLNVLDG